MIVLCAPPPEGIVSGGHLYNQHTALKLTPGHRMRLCLVPAAELDATLPRIVSPDDTLVLDSLYLPSLRNLPPMPRELATSPPPPYPACENARNASERRAPIILVHSLADMDPTLTTREALETRRIVDAGLRCARGFVVMSRHMRDVLLRRLDFAIPVAVCRPGVSDSPARPLPAGPPFEILTVANLFPNKGHLDLVRALARLKDYSWRWTIVGSTTVHPTHARTVERAIHDAGLQARTRLLGAISNEQVGAELARAHVLLQASRHEAYGMVFAEALAAARPVVAFRVGGIPEIIEHATTGYLCTPGAVDELTAALERLLMDRPLLERMHTECARRRANLPTWSQAALSFERAASKMM